MKTLILLVSLLVAAPTTAQTLNFAGDFQFDLLKTYEVVGEIDLTPATPGKEILFRGRNWTNVVLVFVPNGKRSGANGMSPAPGPCLEAPIFLSILEPSLAIIDVNGDGVDDLTAFGKDGAIQLLTFAPGVCNSPGTGPWPAP
jgi:hypothetical protein